MQEETNPFAEWSDEQLLRERHASWVIFTLDRGRDIERADYIDTLDREIERRGLSVSA